MKSKFRTGVTKTQKGGKQQKWQKRFAKNVYLLNFANRIRLLLLKTLQEHSATQAFIRDGARFGKCFQISEVEVTLKIRCFLRNVHFC